MGSWVFINFKGALVGALGELGFGLGRVRFFGECLWKKLMQP